jgi:hypothetical protein
MRRRRIIVSKAREASSRYRPAGEPPVAAAAALWTVRALADGGRGYPRRVRARWLPAAAAITALAAGGCGEDKFAGSPDPASERSDPPADPPPGWRTRANRRAGFTIAVPRGWTARTRRGATLIRSRDRLVAVTVAADRSDPGRTTRPRAYARAAFRALPGFRRLTVTRLRRVRGSPYPSARVDGRATLARRKQRQRITVAAFRRRGRVTYAVVAFAAEARGTAAHAAALTTLLATLRGQRPRL